MPPDNRRLSPLWARCCAAAWLSLMTFGSVSADILFPLSTQQLVPGDLLRHPVNWQLERDRRVQIKLGSAPSEAKLVVSNDGQLFVLWKTPIQRSDTTMIEVVASDIDSGEILDSRQLQIQFVQSENLPAVDDVPLLDDSAAQSESLTASIVHEIESRTHSNTTITAGNGLLDPERHGDPDIPFMPVLPNQVISAGRAINLRVTASIADGTKPVIQVDRLPRNASFDANADGSRTFYWQTGDRDQGEHIFRFTAFNPNESYLRSVRDVLIVVGDPSRNKTIPAENVLSSE